jgi:hypothetical protein
MTEDKVPTPPQKGIVTGRNKPVDNPSKRIQELPQINKQTPVLVIARRRQINEIRVSIRRLENDEWLFGPHQGKAHWIALSEVNLLRETMFLLSETDFNIFRDIHPLLIKMLLSPSLRVKKNMSLWHIILQSLAPTENYEIDFDGKPADAINHEGEAVEFQRSSMSVAEYLLRMHHFGPKATYLFDMSAKLSACQLSTYPTWIDGNITLTFTWKNDCLPTPLHAITSKLFLDLGWCDYFLQVITPATASPIQGILIPIRAFFLTLPPMNY